LTENKIKFDDNYNDEKIESVDLEENICFDEEKNILIIPSNNLVTEKSNEMFYYTRFYDEIIRYDYIKQFVFDVDKYLSLVKQNYNLNENEFILPQTLLTSKYFDNLVEIKSNLNKMYDTAYPQISIPYNNLHKLVNYSSSDDVEQDEENNEDINNSELIVKKTKKKINRCPNGFRRVNGICEPIDKNEWKIIEKDEKKIIYESTTVNNKRIEVLL